MKRYLARLRELTLLIVEDDDFQRIALIKIIKKIGVTNVIGASNGKEALKIINNQPIDIIICDLSMPTMDGLELIRFLGLNHFKGSIMLSSAMDESLIRSASNMAKGYVLNVIGAITKPLQPVVLLKCLMKHFLPRSQTTALQPTFNITAKDLEKAIKDKEIVPFFQPQVCFETGEFISVEALARWQHSKFGLISPIAFIQVAEDNDLMVELTELIYTKSINKLSSLPNTFDKLALSINISPKSISDDIIQYLLLNLDTRINNRARKITLEITEHGSIEEHQKAIEALSRLRMHGFSLALDDFGTGNSTMEQVSNFPFTELKIDKSFVDNMLNDPNSLIIIESCVNLAKRLKLKIVVEGVENLKQWEILKRLGCDLCQGYFVAKPVPITRLESTIEHWNKKYACMMQSKLDTKSLKNENTSSLDNNSLPLLAM
jgi:EAL domain-containing protein (putative c-di-GMP-specific phosphodiesterase class I)/CheY-like chemotaxis protein